MDRRELIERLSASQIKHVVDILESGHCSLSRDTSEDYAEAAAFVFDSGIFFLGKNACGELASDFRALLRSLSPTEGK